MTEVLSRESQELRELVAGRRERFQQLLERYGATNPRLFGSVAQGTADSQSDLDIIVDMDPVEGNLLMRASGLMEESRELFGRDDIDIFPVQLLRESVSQSALNHAIAI